MAGRPSAAMIHAMELVLAGMTPYKAAMRAQIALSTMYRSRLYKLWNSGNKAQLREEMDTGKPVKRVQKLA